MIQPVFFSALLIFLLAFIPEVISQNLTNIGESQQVYASNVNPYQGNGNEQQVQNQQGSNQLLGNNGNPENYSQVQGQVINQAKNYNPEKRNKVETIQKQDRTSLKLPSTSFSFEKVNGSPKIKSISKFNQKNTSLKKIAYKMKKKVKRNFKKNVRSCSKSTNGCFSW